MATRKKTDVKKFDREIERFLRTSRIHAPYLFLMPKNFFSEKKQFMKKISCGEIYNPQFRYRPPKNLEAHKRTLRRLEQESRRLPEEIRMSYVEKIRELSLSRELLMAMGSKRFSKLSEKMILPPTPGLVLLARAILLIQPSRENKKIPQERLEENIPKEFLPNWTITMEDLLSSAVTLSTERKIIIGKNHAWSRQELRRTLEHEKVHAERFENGSKSLSLFAFGFAEYESLEEGLATFHEAKISFFRTLKDPAEKVIAVHYGQKHNFFETFTRLRALIKNDERAFELAMRVKRGTDGSGTYTKDVVYLRGFVQICAYFLRHPFVRSKHLLFGKIGFEEAKQLKKYQQLYRKYGAYRKYSTKAQ